MKHTRKGEQMELMPTGEKAITAYLRQMKFNRKVVGGVDEESVLDQIECITKMYRDLIEGLQRQVEQLQNAGNEKDRRLSSLQMERDAILQQNELLAAKNKDIVNFMQRNESQRTELVAKAQREAQKILMQAKIQAENLVAEKEREIEQLTRRRKAMEVELDNLMLQMKTTMRVVVGDLGQMLNLVNGLDGKLDRCWDGNESSG